MYRRADLSRIMMLVAVLSPTAGPMGHFAHDFGDTDAPDKRRPVLTALPHLIDEVMRIELQPSGQMSGMIPAPHALDQAHSIEHIRKVE